MMDKINIKLQEYQNMLDFNHEYFKNDFKGNYKFVKQAVSKMIKKNESENTILEFLNHVIEIHVRNYDLT